MVSLVDRMLGLAAPLSELVDPLPGVLEVTPLPEGERRRADESKKALPIIGLTGKKRHGKNEVGLILAKQGYRTVAWATALRRELYDIVGHEICESFEEWEAFCEAHKEDPVGSQYGWIGPLMQFWGTEVRRRGFGEFYWIDRTPVVPGVVLTDTRFPNEAKTIRKMGDVFDVPSMIWHIERPGYVYQSTSGRSTSHASETMSATITPDEIIVNDGTLHDLEQRVNETLQRCFGTA